MPMLESSVAITTSQQPSSAALPGEAVARGDAHERDQAAEVREQVEGAAVEARDDRHVDVARAAAAALGEQHDRQPPPLGELEQAVLLHGCARPACRREPCSRRTSPRMAGPRPRPLHLRAHPPGCARSAPRACAGAPARRIAAARTRRRCPRRAALTGSRGAGRARGAGRGRPRRVQTERVALAHRLQVGAPRPGRSGPAARRLGCRTARGQHQQQLALVTASPTATSTRRTRRRPARAPRAPSSSPRARSAPRRLEPAGPADARRRSRRVNGTAVAAAGIASCPRTGVRSCHCIRPRRAAAARREA